MMNKIKLYLQRLLGITPKETYIKWIEQFEKDRDIVATTPKMLMECWSRININHFKLKDPYKSMMYVDLNLKHKSLGELFSALIITTGAIAHNDAEGIKHVSQNYFNQNHQLTLDTYFVELDGKAIEYHDGLNRLKAIMAAHAEVLEHQMDSYHNRMLYHMYNDIRTLTHTLVYSME